LGGGATNPGEKFR
jgi:hypothetical protein